MQSIDHYVLDHPIASGAEGSVYQGRDTYTQQPVAVKVVKLHSQDTLEKIRREQALLRSANSNFLVRILDLVQSERNLYVVYPLYPTDLRRFLVHHGPISEDNAQRWTTQLIKGLVDVHFLDVVHRDLKPANILLTQASLEADLVLTDFGISALCLDVPLTTFAGSWNYMAPEILEGQPYDTKADVYSLGLVTLEMLGGQPPNQFPRDISAEVHSFLHACLEKDPARRPSAYELAAHPFVRRAKRERLSFQEGDPVRLSETLRMVPMRMDESLVVERIGEEAPLDRLVSVFAGNEGRDQEIHQLRGALIDNASQLEFYAECLAHVYSMNFPDLQYYFLKAHEPQLRQCIANAKASRFCGTNQVQTTAETLNATLEATLYNPPPGFGSGYEANLILNEVENSLTRGCGALEKTYLKTFVEVAAGLCPDDLLVQNRCTEVKSWIDWTPR